MKNLYHITFPDGTSGYRWAKRAFQAACLVLIGNKGMNWDEANYSASFGRWTYKIIKHG